MDDTKYWNTFYNDDRNKITEPSNFCLFVMDYFKDNGNIKNILDAGCGNGRDSYHLSQKYNVDAIDNSGYLPENKDNCVFSTNDFVKMDKKKYDLVYSRFTFHSITNEQQLEFLKTIEKDCYVCIETRSNKSENEYRQHGDDHYRNFTDLFEIHDVLFDNKYDMPFMKECRDFAPYKNENPYCIRIVCQKL